MITLERFCWAFDFGYSSLFVCFFTFASDMDCVKCDKVTNKNKFLLNSVPRMLKEHSSQLTHV